MKSKHWAIVALLALGALKLPLEHRVFERLTTDEVLPPRMEVGVMESLGQMGLAASMGGLRSLVASGFYLHAAAAWDDKDWGAVDNRMSIATRLDPRYDGYWDNAGSFMAYDAASYSRDQASFYTRQLYGHYVQRGIEILKQGLAYLPRSYRLHQNLGEIYSARPEPPDPKLAGEHFLTAFQNGALPVYERRAAYEFTKTNNPDCWKQAREILLKHYAAGNKLPGVIANLKALEQKLDVPPSQRIPEPMPPQFKR